MADNSQIENRAIPMNVPQQANNQGMIPSADSESLSRVISPPTYILDSPPNPSHGRNDQEYSDSSWPLFSLYLEKTEEEDNRLAELWPKDAKSIIIFVRISISISISFPLHISCHYRPVYSLPSSPRYLPSLSSTSSRIRRKGPTSTSRICISYNFSQARMHPYLPPWLNPHPSLHRNTSSG